MVNVMDCISMTYPHPIHPVRCDGCRAPDGHDRSLSSDCTLECGSDSQAAKILTVEEEMIPSGNTLNEEVQLFYLR